MVSLESSLNHSIFIDGSPDVPDAVGGFFQYWWTGSTLGESPTLGEFPTLGELPTLGESPTLGGLGVL